MGFDYCLEMFKKTTRSMQTCQEFGYNRSISTRTLQFANMQTHLAADESSRGHHSRGREEDGGDTKLHRRGDGEWSRASRVDVEVVVF